MDRGKCVFYKSFVSALTEKNALAFEGKRTCVLGKTHLRLGRNVLVFKGKRTCVFPYPNSLRHRLCFFFFSNRFSSACSKRSLRASSTKSATLMR